MVPRPSSRRRTALRSAHKQFQAQRYRGYPMGVLFIFSFGTFTLGSFYRADRGESAYVFERSEARRLILIRTIQDVFFFLVLVDLD